jgi:phosphoribosylanthranilate isomerase
MSINVKICGITREEDAQLAVELGAWALGFICYEKSPRYIDAKRIRAIIDSLPKERNTRMVAVFVNASAQTILDLVAETGIDTIQLHGDETPSICGELKELSLWKAFRLYHEGQFKLTAAFTPHVEAFLYDAAVPGQYGGTGHLVDWELLDKAPRLKPLLVSGGLNPENALSAWQRFKPMALDLSSGVESSPGIKDPIKLNRLFSALAKG